MRYLLFSSLLFLFTACTSLYRHLQPTNGDASCLQKFQPRFTTTAIYTTQVDIIGNYLSGLLVIKQMPDSSTRIVFTSEMGLSFFDFEFGAHDSFRVHYIIPKMNRKAVINTLRKDFEAVLMTDLGKRNPLVLRQDDRIYYSFPQEKGSNYYITDPECRDLLGIEKASRRKAVAKMIMKNYRDGIPDTIGITHTNFRFTIGLKRLQR